MLRLCEDDTELLELVLVCSENDVKASVIRCLVGILSYYARGNTRAFSTAKRRKTLTDQRFPTRAYWGVTVPGISR